MFTANPRTVFNFPAFQNTRYYPIGLDIDDCGNLYTALYNASMILKISPR